MARFRRSGTNWEGRAWKTSPALNALMNEIEAAYPLRGPGDGTVASEQHDKLAPKSDHRPYPYEGPGVVNAVDAGEYVEDQAIRIAQAIHASRDPRVRYVIHEGRAFYTYYRNDGYKPWDWRPYTGTSPHENHVHVSVDRARQNDGSAWNLGLTAGLGEEEEVTDAEIIKIRNAILSAPIGNSELTLAQTLQNTHSYAKQDFLNGDGLKELGTKELAAIAKSVNDEMARRQAN